MDRLATGNFHVNVECPYCKYFTQFRDVPNEETVIAECSECKSIFEFSIRVTYKITLI